MKKYAELFYDDDIDRLVDVVYKSCIDKDCATCPNHSNIEENACMTEFICELWRRLQNSKECCIAWENAYKSLLQDVHDHQGSICCYCKNYNRNNCEYFSDLPTEDGIPLSCGKFMWRHEVSK